MEILIHSAELKFMNKEEAKVRIDELSKIIESHNYNYYILAQPTISDYDFDMLLNELISLEKQYPEFITADSPTQRVGGDITKEFQTRFTQRFGNLDCHALKANPTGEGTEMAKALNCEAHCRKMVVSGTELLHDMMSDLKEK